MGAGAVDGVAAADDSPKTGLNTMKVSCVVSSPLHLVVTATAA
ncbi:MAG: hypothetical protein ACT4OV_13635 [Microthrixaceae bacterium]